MAQTRVDAQIPEKRIKNFYEVSLGFSKRIAYEEARRCPQCSDPACVKACPLKIDIPGFIRMLREGRISDAYGKIKENNCLPSICGRICSAPCEEACILKNENAPINIRALERYVSDFGKSKRTKKEISKGKKIAVIGAGPCGLCAASELIQKGFQVTIFEAMDSAGGVLKYGVPDFRIPKKVLDGEINDIKAAGIQIEYNFFGGRISSIKELLDKNFSAVLIATGAGIPKFKDIPGINLRGVYYGEEFLMRVNLLKTNIFQNYIPTFDIGEKVVVVGSGNTALDCARVARRFGKKVTLISKRTEGEMRVRKEEREYAKEEGINFESMVKTVSITRDQNNSVSGIKCIKLDFAETDKEGAWDLVTVPDSEFIIEADTVIIAVGHSPNTILICNDPEIKLTKEGTIKVDEKNMTSMPGVFAAGNVICNSRPLIDNMASGKMAVNNIIEYLKNNA